MEMCNLCTNPKKECECRIYDINGNFIRYVRDDYNDTSFTVKEVLKTMTTQITLLESERYFTEFSYEYKLGQIMGIEYGISLIKEMLK